MLPVPLAGTLPAIYTEPWTELAKSTLAPANFVSRNPELSDGSTQTNNIIRSWTSARRP